MSTAKKTKKLEAVSDDASTAIATTQTQLPAAANQAQIMNEWGVQNLTSRDVVIAKILPMQAMSKKVVDGQARLGEFRDSLNNEVIGMAEGFGTPAKPLEFVPFYMEKTWLIFEDKTGTGQNMKFTKTVAIDQTNESWPFEETINGVKIRRDRTMNFYCLHPSQVADGTALPFLLSFRRTSAKAGQKLATTMFMSNIKAGKTPASMVMELTGVKTSNDKGTFVVLDVKQKRESSAGEVAEAFSWLKQIRAGAAKVDNSDLESEADLMSGAAPAQSDQF